MPKVHVEIGQCWNWTPKKPEDGERTVEVSAEMLEKYDRVAIEFYRLQEFFEHAFRAQEGFRPFDESPFEVK